MLGLVSLEGLIGGCLDSSGVQAETHYGMSPDDSGDSAHLVARIYEAYSVRQQLDAPLAT